MTFLKFAKEAEAKLKAKSNKMLAKAKNSILASITKCEL